MKASLLFSVLTLFSTYSFANEPVQKEPGFGEQLFLPPPLAADEEWQDAKVCVNFDLDLRFYYFTETKNLFVEGEFSPLGYLENEKKEKVLMGWDDKVLNEMIEAKGPHLSIIEILVEQIKSGLYVLAATSSPTEIKWETIYDVLVKDGTIADFDQLTLESLWKETAPEVLEQVKDLAKIKYSNLNYSGDTLTLTKIDSTNKKEDIKTTCVNIWTAR